MTQQHDLTAEAIQRGALPGRGYAVARLLSQIFHPIILGLLSIFFIGLFAVEQRMIGLIWAMICALILVVPPTIFFTMRLRQGAYSDEDVSDRTQRNELYLFGMVNLLIGSLVLWVFDAPLPFLALFGSTVLINLLCWIINLSWKISVHAASMSSTATLFTIYIPPLGGFLWLCALSLGWARVRTRNHTPGQVLAGTALAASCVLLAFWGLGLL